MFIYLRLVLAHFLGDFPFQFNKIFEWKNRGFVGCMPHALIQTACFLLLSWPYLGEPSIWIFSVGLGIVHLVQDWLKIRLTKSRGNDFLYYCLDQIFHIAAITYIFATPLARMAPPEANGSLFVELYNSDKVILYLIGFFAATYNGYYMIMLIFTDLLKIPRKYIDFEKWYGIFERTLIITAIAFRGLYLVLLPIALVSRLLTYRLCKDSHSISEHFVGKAEIIMSWLIAVIVGFFLSVVL